MAASIVDIILRAKNQASKELDKVTKQLGSMNGSSLAAVGGLTALAGGFAALKAGEFALEMTKVAAKFDTLNNSFKQLASGVGADSDRMLSAMRNASQGMISDMSLVQSANRALLLGVADTSQEMSQLLQVAIVRGQAMGLSAEQAFNDLVTGLGRMSPLILDNLGIVTGGEKVFDDFATSIGKTADQLTDAEKKQALFNKVVTESEGMLNDATESGEKGFQQLAAAVENAKKAIGSVFSDEVRVMAGQLAEKVDALAESIDNFAERKREIKIDADFANVVDELENVKFMRDQMLRDIKTNESVGMDTSGYADALDSLNKRIVELDAKAKEMARDMAAGMGGATDAINPLFQTVRSLDELLATPFEVKLKPVSTKEIEDAIAKVNELRDQFAGQATASEYEYFGAAQGAMSQTYEEQIAALRRWADRQREANKASAEGAAAQRELQDEIDKTIDRVSMSAAQDVYKVTGNADEAISAYNLMSESLNNFVAAQRDHKLTADEIIGLLPVEAQRVLELESAFSSILGDIDLATQGIDAFSEALAIASGNMAALIEQRYQFGAAATASEYQYFGGGAGPVPQSPEERIAQLKKETDAKRQAAIDEYNWTKSQRDLSVNAAKEINKEYEKVKSTVSSIVSGAIGPVAGVDADSLLADMGMRPDAINENARRLADIAVKGIDPKSQTWLQEFANEVPGVWDEIAQSDDPRKTAAIILKQFQDGLRPELIDKERAKELVRTALTGGANTQQLIDEIAGELAGEMGVSVSEAKAKAEEVLGGGTGGGGAVGVSLAPTIDSTAAGQAASTFASAFTSAIEGGSLGADLSGAVYGQVMASITLIEQTGTEAGNALVRGMSATFTSIPQNLIAALAGLVLPLVQAGITNQGTRTGAAGV